MTSSQIGHLLSQQVVLDNAEKRAKFWCQISACFQKMNEVKSKVMQALSEALNHKNRKSSSEREPQGICLYRQAMKCKWQKNNFQTKPVNY